MSIQSLTRLLACLLLVGPSLDPPSAAAPPSSGDSAAPPNIILFLVDDLGARDIGVGGSDYYLTPHVDRLAARGTMFTQAYASYPRCVPSRFAIVTGRNPAREGVPGRSEKLDAVNLTVARALQENGYGTYFLGKWHLGHAGEGNGPEDRGFEVNIGGGSAGAPGSYTYPFHVKKGKGKDNDKEEGSMPGLEEGTEGEQLTDRLTHEADALIRRHVAQRPDQPFFMELAHYGVHTPLEDGPDKVEQFKQRLKQMPAPAGPDYVDADRDGTTKQHQDHPVYAAMVSRVDDSLGTLMDTLEELGVADNTLIVFTSDHGGLSNRGLSNKRDLATSNLPLRAGKGHLFEGGIRVPLIVAWPAQIPAGQTSAFLTTGADHFPSFLAAAGLPLQPRAHIDGDSYLDAARGKTADRGEAIYWHNPRPRPGSTGDHGSSAVRLGDWKLIRWYDIDDVDLYHLSEDPGEQNDLADQQPAKTEELSQLLDDWLASFDAVKSREK